MGKHILFMIHGIGIHEPTWAEEPDGPAKTLQQLSKEYAFFKKKELSSLVMPISVHYDEIFQGQIKEWQQDAGRVSQIDPTGTLAHSLTWLSSASEQNFWWSHVADLAMYMLSPLYRNRVRIRVISQIADVIEQTMDNDGSATCSVLAHSMGTAVAHDSLHLLGTVRWGGHENVLNPRHWRFNHLFMVANTSRLLQTVDEGMKKAYDSIVRPGPIEDPSSYCATYWNFRHEADPVPYPRMFEPVGWKNYNSVVVRHYREVNIHNLSHYLLNPRVHIPILRKLCGPRAVTNNEEITAVNSDKYPQFGGQLEFINKAKDLAARLKSIQASLGDDPAATDYLKALLKMYALWEAYT